jgi:phage replication-related protein YjqB (UPF0714/DUF867 family)
MTPKEVIAQCSATVKHPRTGELMVGRGSRKRADAILSALAAAGYAVVRWPPTGDDVQRCADEVNPYAATAEQYSLTVETVCDVIATWMRLAAAAQEPEA